MGRCAWLAALVGTGVLIGCAARRPRVGEYAIVSPRAVEVPADFELHLKQTACFGSCPVYDLELDASGATAFAGHEYTVVDGERTGFVPPGRVGAVVRELERVTGSRWGDSAGAGCMVVRDESEVIIEGVVDGRPVVLNTGDMCDARRAAPLFRLAERVLDLTGARAWVHPIPRCQWRVDRVAAQALMSSPVGVPTDSDGLAASVSAVYADQRATRVHVSSHRRGDESRRSARARAERLASVLAQFGLPRDRIILDVDHAGRGDDVVLEVTLESPHCGAR